MATLYAVLASRNPWNSQQESLVEIVNLDSLSLEAVIPLGNWRPTTFVVSTDDQRLYLVDRANQQVVVYDTTGILKAKVPVPSPPFDCALTKDGSVLLLSTVQGLASLDTSSLQVTNTVDGPTQAAGNPSESAGAIALSPDSDQLAVLGGGVGGPPPQPQAQDLWLVDPVSLKVIQSFNLPAPYPNTGYGVGDVVYASGAGKIVFAGLAGFVGALDPETGQTLPWKWLKKNSQEGADIDNTPHTLIYSAKANRVFLVTGRVVADKVFYAALWKLHPSGSNVTWTDGFGGAPGVACLEPEESFLYVSVRRPTGLGPDGPSSALPDRLARYTISSKNLAPNVHTFSRNDLSVIAMQAVGGSVFDPPPGDFYAEQSVEILIGLIGGGGGWVVTPGGKIKPIDPEPFRPSARRLRDIIGRVLRTAMVAQAATNVADAKTRQQIQNRALAYAKQQLAKANLGKTRGR